MRNLFNFWQKYYDFLEIPIGHIYYLKYRFNTNRFVKLLYTFHTDKFESFLNENSKLLTTE